MNGSLGAGHIMNNKFLFTLAIVGVYFVIQLVTDALPFMAQLWLAIILTDIPCTIYKHIQINKENARNNITNRA